jgi:signal transduction histidine kinase
LTTTKSTISADHLYLISETISQAKNWKTALDEVISQVRTFLLFDNMVVYSMEESGQLNVIFARALGRGKKAEAEVSWGESLANRAAETMHTVVEEPQTENENDRLKKPFLIGIPLISNNRLLGVMTFIRFGGPAFTQHDIQLAEYIAHQTAMLVSLQILEAEQAKMEKERQQAQLKEDFISTISHELRTPLGFIKGYATTLLRTDTEWDKATQQEFLQIIEQEADHLQELIENLLDSSRLQSGQLKLNFQLLRIDIVCNDVIARLRFQHPDLNVTQRYNKQPAPISGDPNRLAQVFQNIIGNAIKYAAGSEIIITIDQDRETTHISIQDHGPGIPEKYLPFIFNRFFRVPNQSPSVHGSGLGLFICQQVIHTHNGQIKIESVEGKGTTFHIYLPNKH